MGDSKFLASVHEDYLPFVSLASDAELVQFIRAQIAVSQGEAIPSLDGMAKALFDTHVALMARLEASRESGKMRGRSGGAPHGNQNAKKQSSVDKRGNETIKNNQNQSNEQTNQSKNKPVTDTESVTDTVLTADADTNPMSAREAETPAPATPDTAYTSALTKHYLSHIQPTASGLIIEQLCAWTDTFPDEVVMMAIDEAVKHNKRSLKYIEGILRGWQGAGFVTKSLVEGHLRAWDEKKAAARGSPVRQRHKSRFAANCEGHNYDYDEIERLALEYSDKAASEDENGGQRQ